MDSVKYIGMDVHKEAISVAVLNFSSKLVMECTIETKANTILDFLKGLRGSLHVTLEEGTWAAWVYHGEHGVRTLRELARSYLTISTDLIRVMTRVKAIYRSWGIACRGKQVYAERYRAEWLRQIPEDGVGRRGGFYFQPVDAVRGLRPHRACR